MNWGFLALALLAVAVVLGIKKAIEDEIEDHKNEQAFKDAEELIETIDELRDKANREMAKRPPL